MIPMKYPVPNASTRGWGPFIAPTQEHFGSYVRRPRDPANQASRKTFHAAVTRQRNLDGERENDIGMTEDEFKGKA